MKIEALFLEADKDQDGIATAAEVKAGELTAQVYSIQSLAARLGPCPLRHFIENWEKLMLVDQVFKIFELLANIFNKSKLFG